jgi:hypothetical protein
MLNINMLGGQRIAVFSRFFCSWNNSGFIPIFVMIKLLKDFISLFYPEARIIRFPIFVVNNLSVYAHASFNY